TESAPEDSEGPGYRVYSLKPGDQVLIFLKKGEDEKKAPELADYSDGIKRMTPERLDAYTARIKELNSIFSAKEIDRSKIADWLVRCIEDPITRWEGAYELLRSFRRLDYQKSKNPPAIGNTENKENSGAGAEPEAATDNSAGESVEKPAVVLIDGLPAAAKTIAIDEDVEYAQLVTDQHKQTLLNLVLQQKMVDDTGKHRELKSGDAELIEIVSRWGDNRLAKYLLDVLPAMSDDVYTSSDLMDTVAEIIKDDELEKIAEDYSDVRYKENEELVEMDDAESKEADAAANKAESSDGAKPEGGTSNVKDEEPKEPEAPKMTYKDLRRNLMEKYMQRSVVALALAESRQMEKERASR
ncbi:MAG TPA: hypothetical protein VNA22_04530, partial [Pyrinomonadaceae bacterium]|nr:hypothetical protein [Pyrinomonadaceae bacterium]